MAELLALSEAETEDCLSDMVSFNPLAVQGFMYSIKQCCGSAVIWLSWIWIRVVLGMRLHIGCRSKEIDQILTNALEFKPSEGVLGDFYVLLLA
jgi:hypothetical protein